MGLLTDVRADLRSVQGHPALVFLTNRGVHALFAYRLAHRAWRYRIPLVPQVLTRIIQILYGIDIDWRAMIAGGCCIVHGVGLVIGQGAKVGAGCTLYHGVTLGVAHSQPDGFPELEDKVLVGAGAKILGPVRIGAGARIGANAVVLRQVPPGAVAVGIPARVVAASSPD